MMARASMSAAFPRSPRAGASSAPPQLEAGILARCRAQDPLAFRAFVARYERMVFALLSRMLGHGTEVEDLAQETFVRAYRAFPGFDPEGPAKVSTWLLTIATRLALDARKRRTLDVQPITDDTDGTTGSTPEISVERRELGNALADAAAKLPDDQRAALVLVDLHGLSIAEVAAVLEIPENTAKTRLFRAREKMRAALSTDWRTT
jgi:RNA polymerase sigma-70 factor (ECF subfamily)